MIQLIIISKAFHSTISKMIVKYLSLFSPWNLTFKHNLDAEIDLEEQESKIYKDWDIWIVWLLKTPLNGLYRQRTGRFIGRFGRGHWIWLFILNQWFRWNVWMWIVAIKSHQFDRRWSTQILSHSMWRRSVPRSRPSDRESTSEMSPHVHRSPSSVFYLSRYKSLDKWLRLNHFKRNSRPITVRRVPPWVQDQVGKPNRATKY